MDLDKALIITVKFKQYAFRTTMLCLILFSLQCQGNRQASVEQLNGTSRILLPLYMEKLVGLRDGETVDVEVKFVSNSAMRADGQNSPDSLILKIQLRFGVPTRFESGSFSWHQQGELFQGPLTSSSVTYHGGQGARPSMDGRFRFRIADDGHYEAFIPTTEIGRF